MAKFSLSYFFQNSHSSKHVITRKEQTKQSLLSKGLLRFARHEFI